MWRHTNLVGFIPATIIDISRHIYARLIDIHKYMDNHVAIITQTDMKMIQFNSYNEIISWNLTSITKFHLPSHVSFSCLSYNKTCLAVLSETYELALYHFCENRKVLLLYVKMNEEPYFTYKFSCKITCCDISQNEQYIAVGTEKGQISVSLFHDLALNSLIICSRMNLILFFFLFLDYRYRKANGDYSTIFSQRSHHTIVLGSHCYRRFDFTLSDK